MKRILQITDTHLSHDGNPINGISVYEKLSDLLSTTVIYDTFDLIIFSGDIADKGASHAYRWIRSELEKWKDITLWMPGNHDSSKNMEENLSFVHRVEIEKSKINYKVDLDGFQVLCLDTGNDTLSEKQLDWAIEETNENTIIFIHHPPIKCGARFMDQKYPLQNWQEVAKKLKANSKKRFRFFCGHYHTESFVADENIEVFLTPSTMLQIDRNHPNYMISHLQTGCRIVEIASDHSVRTYCHYLEKH